MPKAELPRFVIYQPNEKEFHICLESGGNFLRWSSLYAPTLDVNFPREVIRIEDLPLKSRPKKQIYDEGTYAITQSKPKSKEVVEAAAAEGVDNKSFSFVLNGKKLQGRFAFKRKGKTTVLQKFKDKYAKDEDVLSGDLVRTIKTMIPDYDESKIKLTRPKKAKPEVIPEPVEEPVEELTADKVIGNTEYHFAFYTAENEPEICLITSAGDEVIALKKVRNQWALLQPISSAALKKKNEFTDHAKALYNAIGN